MLGGKVNTKMTGQLVDNKCHLNQSNINQSIMMPAFTELALAVAEGL